MMRVCSLALLNDHGKSHPPINKEDWLTYSVSHPRQRKLVKEDAMHSTYFWRQQSPLPMCLPLTCALIVPLFAKISQKKSPYSSSNHSCWFRFLPSEIWLFSRIEIFLQTFREKSSKYLWMIFYNPMWFARFFLPHPFFRQEKRGTGFCKILFRRFFRTDAPKPRNLWLPFFSRKLAAKSSFSSTQFFVETFTR